MKIETSRHCSMVQVSVHVGRYLICVTNRPRLFEERKRPAIRGWWFVIIKKGVQ